MNSSFLIPLWEMMLNNVPLASSSCFGTTTVIFLPSSYFTRIKWLPDKQILRCPSAVTLRAEGLTITADALDLHVPEETVTSTAQVRMRTPHGRLTGRNLTYNLKTGDYTMDGIQAVFTVEQAREDLERLR